MYSEANATSPKKKHLKLKDIRKDKADNFVLDFCSPIHLCRGKKIDVIILSVAQIIEFYGMEFWKSLILCCLPSCRLGIMLQKMNPFT